MEWPCSKFKDEFPFLSYPFKSVVKGSKIMGQSTLAKVLNTYASLLHGRLNNSALWICDCDGTAEDMFCGGVPKPNDFPNIL